MKPLLRIENSLFRGVVAFAVLLTVGAGVAAAQETWAPEIVFDGVNITVNGVTQPIVDGLVGPPPPPIYSSWSFGNSPFLYPNGITENPLTHEWIVADTYHGRLLRFATDRHPTAADGAFLGAISTTTLGEISSPYGPIVDDQGTILVADYDASAVKVYVPTVGGGYTGYAVWSFTDAVTIPADPRTVAFDQPQRLAFLPDPDGGMRVKDGVGSLVVLDTNSHRVLKLTLSAVVGAASPVWSLALAFGENGVGDGLFNHPAGLAIDAAGRIYVSDPNNATSVTIQVFNASGELLQKISQGLAGPWSLSIAPDGRLFVADTGNNRIAVFDKFDAGNPAASLAPLSVRIGSASQPLGGLNLPGGPNPAGPAGELQEPTALAFDHLGRLLVADTDNFRIQVFGKSHLSVAVIALPQIVPLLTSSVDVLVSISLPPGETEAVTNVIPATPSVSFSVAGGSGSEVVSPTPTCVQTPSSAGGCVTLPIVVGESLDVGGRLDYIFTFAKNAGTIGPVWFSVNASGLRSGSPVVAGTAQTYAVAIDGTPPASPPTITASLPAGMSNGWFKSQPVDVTLEASVPPGSGVVQEIEYNFGPTPPLEGDYHVCYNVFTIGGAPTCSIPVFKEGVTTLWYRALSSRGLYDTLVPYAPNPSITVPGWTAKDVNLDFTPPAFLFAPATDTSGNPLMPYQGWFNTVPLTVDFQAFDTGSLLESLLVENNGPAPGFSHGLCCNVAFVDGALTFGATGLYDVTLTAGDRAGNPPGVFNGAMKIDATAPVLSSAPTVGSPTGTVQTGGGTIWSKSMISVTFDATDDLSGFDADGTLTAPGGCSTLVESGQNQSVSCSVEDWAGNTSVSPLVGPFGIDNQAPTVVAAPDPPVAFMQSTGWYDGPVRVGFHADDNGGVGFAGGAQQADTEQFSNDGSIVSETFTDALGNNASGSAGPFNIDTATPTVAVTITDNTSGGPIGPAPDQAVIVGGTKWFNEPVRIWFTGDDIGSGFEQSNPVLHQERMVAVVSGPVTVAETFTDLVGHSAQATEGPFNVDALAPSVTFATSPAAGVLVGTTRWYRISPLNVTFTADDGAGSGFPSGRFAVAAAPVVDNEAWATFTDLVHNTTVSRAGPFAIDAVPPAIADPLVSAPDALVGTTAWYRGSITVTFDASDNGGSGFQDPDTLQFTQTRQSTATSDGAAVTGTFTDLVGNSRSRIAGPFNVDATGPVVTAATAYLDNRPASGVLMGGIGWFTRPIAVTLTATDAGAGFSTGQPVLTETYAELILAGPQTIAHSFTDVLGNSATGSAGPYGVDDTGPVLSAADIVVSAVTAADLVVTFAPTATDNPLLPPPTVVCAPGSGSTFPLGTTTVACTATDALGNTTSDTFEVKVNDVMPPTLTVPASILRFALAPTPIDFVVTATDNFDANQAIVCTWPSGATFPLGTTTVSCTATDASGNSITRTFDVTLSVATAPVCTGAAANPASLWPPNHNLVSIGFTGVTNADGGLVTYTITSIFQDEPTNGLGDGDTAIDGFGVGTSQARVRRERSGKGNGRVYYIGFTAATAGGSCSAVVTAGVPHDRGRGPAIGGGPLFDSTE